MEMLVLLVRFEPFLIKGLKKDTVLEESTADTKMPDQRLQDSETEIACDARQPPQEQCNPVPVTSGQVAGTNCSNYHGNSLILVSQTPFWSKWFYVC